MRNLIFASLGLALPLVAAAQPPPPPPPPPSGGGGMPGEEAPDEPKMRFDVGLVAALPQGDLSDLDVDTSFGLNLAFGYTVIPNVSVGAGLRYISVSSPRDDAAGFDISNYDFNFTGRYTFPVSPTVKAFGEAIILISTLSASANGDSQSESGIGFGARGGALFNVSGRISVGGALSYTTADIDLGDASLTTAWLGVEGFASFGF